MTILAENSVSTGQKPAPYVAAYIRRHVLMTPREMAQAQQGIIAFARARGLEIAEIFVEELETVPDAFARMAEKLHGTGERVVILPGVHHLAGLGSPPLVALQAFTADGVQVLIAGHVE
ncbi:hypothetical protein F1D05_31620 [Kribbella qitaiheensis]|uniref:Recombinase family protein n=1 Tax=Kribbella qitaiheensis TaxID=1544730 RepID=A0A7G6X5X5_9ACTN|nr:hypothetical protein [Kribbella qitaiheensis]QNE21640.1 hypothetical protein F1D05_31620 [Kribbella qitaiheensis]